MPGIHNPLRLMAEAVADDLERSRIRCVQLAPADDLGPNVLLRDPGKALPGSAAWSPSAGEDLPPGD